MAEKLLLYYRYMKNQQGLPGQVKLAQETKIPTTKAAMESDTAANIQLFRSAIRKLTGQEPPIL
jgi:hypothetical protein